MISPNVVGWLNGIMSQKGIPVQFESISLPQMGMSTLRGQVNLQGQTIPLEATFTTSLQGQNLHLQNLDVSTDANIPGMLWRPILKGALSTLRMSARKINIVIE